ncbi:MAG: hypothetical protein E6Q24_05545 [Chitinophagaceae bacterium]|nr:MAG: hypothetical protein E6Q24_05545 [Chitinophagaceae bacterium]
MEARKKRNIRPGSEHSHLFPDARNTIRTIRKFANVNDTLSFIPRVVKATSYQTADIAKVVKGANVYETCKNVWEFVYRHINYKKDEEGFEQVRSPARAWHDRKWGVDCDCYSVFISSILTNLKIPHILRITKYAKNYFQHIYPVVLHGSRQITIDCVTDYFDYEVPYSEKKDFIMDLQYLDGFDGFDEFEGLDGELGLFGKKKKKKKAAAAAAAALPSPDGTVPAPVIALPKPKKKGFFKKVLNVVNKVNPVTLLLRNGVLAAMKLNIKNVAKRLRWSYLPPDKIAQHGIDPAKYQKLVATRVKLENIFYGAGGNPKNFKKAILSGKGNKDKAVSGLGMLPMIDWSDTLNEHSPLGELLGDEIYYSENVEGMEGFGGFGELGEPISLASIGAAMGVIAGIVASLKQIGSIFKKGSPGDADFDEALTDSAENNVNASAAASAAAKATAAAATAPVPAAAANLPTVPDSSAYEEAASSNYPASKPANTPASYTEDDGYQQDDENLNPAQISANAPSSTGTGNEPGKKGFWDKNKKWLKPVAIGAGGLILIAVGYKLMKGNKAAPKPPSRSGSLSGLPRKRKKKNKRKSKIKEIALF